MRVSYLLPFVTGTTTVVSATLLTLAMSGCGSSGGGAAAPGPSTPTEVGTAPSVLSGTWTGTYTYDDGTQVVRATPGGLPTSGHPSFIIFHLTQSLPAVPVDVTFTITYEVVDGIVTGTYSDSAGRTGAIDGTFDPETNEFVVAVTPDVGQNFSLEITAVVEPGEGAAAGSFGGTVIIDPDTTDDVAPFTGEATAAKRFFGADSADFASHPVGDFAEGTSFWLREGENFALYEVTIDTVGISWDPDGDGIAAPYAIDVFRFAETGFEGAATFYFAKAHNGALYEVLPPIGDVPFYEAELWLPAVLTVNEDFTALSNETWRVVNLNATTTGGIAGSYQLNRIDEDSRQFIKPDVGPVQWVKTSGEVRYKIAQPEFGEASGDFTPMTPGRWTAQSAGVEGPYTTDFLEYISLTDAILEWNGTEVATRRVSSYSVGRFGGEWDDQIWFSKAEDGAIYLLHQTSSEGGGEAATQTFIPPLKLLPGAPQVGQTWVDAVGDRAVVSSVNATSPGGVSASVQVDWYADDGDVISDIQWWKNGVLVAWRAIDSETGEREQGYSYPQDFETPTFTGTSGTFTPSVAGSWFNYDDANVDPIATDWVLDAVNPVDAVTLSAETISWNGQSIATQKVTLGADQEWLARASDGAIYLLRVQDEGQMSAFDLVPPLLKVPAAPSVGTLAVGHGVELDVASVTGVSPMGVSGCVIIREIEPESISTYWWKDGTMVAWRWENTAGTEVEAGFPVPTFSADAFNPLAPGSWTVELRNDLESEFIASGSLEMTVSSATITWNEQANQPTRQFEVLVNDAVDQIEWWARTTAGALVSLRRQDNSDVEPVLEELVFPELLLPSAPAVGQTWTNVHGRTVAVTNVTATSPGGVAGCVQTVETGEGWTDTLWYKDGTLVAFQMTDTVEGAAERGFKLPE